MLKNSHIDRLLAKDTLSLAKGILGCKLCTCVKGVLTSGIIVETEAYHGNIDPACHCFYKRTKRNEIMFSKSGTCYVYFIYGMHYCVNIVSEAEGIGAAVLLRAVEPLDGIQTMARRRKTTNVKAISNGPAKLCEALGIDKKMLGANMRSSSLIWLEAHKKISSDLIETSSRVGISKGTELQWRFYIRGNSFVSRA